MEFIENDLYKMNNKEFLEKLKLAKKNLTLPIRGGPYRLRLQGDRGGDRAGERSELCVNNPF